ncbi:MAG: hypothetical protein N4A68_07550 [Maledivibacter sp.]|jgi:hypothetical protein|nr:hypothetical protein [Maledivibacter sp.]
MLTIEKLEQIIKKKEGELMNAIIMGGDPTGTYTLQQLQSNIQFLNDYLIRLKMSQSE